MGSCGFTFLEDKETRKCLILLHFRAQMGMETVGVESDFLTIDPVILHIRLH